ncbi:hypothetical protein AVEN_96442-1 [Araneus ventricosus]|uniref:Uncharacterized protein n=1 Tax=Araneus ventricosus TaxID=182803 RepID=A0A4Y2D6G5_ARAVE|nr:hypothetical protein AVEN_96442-1 [Araneus ventricosus]
MYLQQIPQIYKGRRHGKCAFPSGRPLPTSVAALSLNCTKADVTRTCQSVAESHKSLHVYVTVGRECAKQLVPRVTVILKGLTICRSVYSSVIEHDNLKREPLK